MAAPVVSTVYPADEDTGIPIGITVKVWFDSLVDLKSVRNAIHLFGADFDRTSGPDSAIWVDQDTGINSFLLSSPGFTGNAPLKYELKYYNLTTEAIVDDPGVISSTADAVSADVGHVVYMTLDPKFAPSLAPDTEYTLYIVGDDVNNSGVTGRTIFDVEPDAGNTGDGVMYVYGIWEGVGTDTLEIEITDAGDVAEAKYKWKYASEAPSEYRYGKLTSRKYRTIVDGVQVRFGGSGFDVGDIFTVNLEAAEFTSSSYSITFTTGDGSFAAAPDSPSTPATSSPASSTLPWLGSEFQVDYMVPADGSYNVDRHKRLITIYFTDDVDDATVTEDSLELWNYPVSGHYEDTYEPYRLKTDIEVIDNKILIRY